MRTLSTELGALVQRGATGPRIYADANVPAGLVAFMRSELRWDVFFVMEQPDLRRASDIEHYRLARQMRRTLITLDRDYFDDRRFPPAESGGVVVLSAPDERQLARLLRRLDPGPLRPVAPTPDGVPLAGRNLPANPELPTYRPPRRWRRR
jgi:hypothetical protein